MLEQLYKDIVQQIGANQFLTGGLILGLLGTALHSFRHVPMKLLDLLKRKFAVSLEIRDDQVFQWFAEWLGDHQYGKRCRILSVARATGNESGRPRSDDEEQPRIVFAPGRGHHFFRYGKRFFWLERARDEAPGKSEIEQLFAKEYMILRTWGSNPSVAKSMLKEAVDYVWNLRHGKVPVYTNDGYGNWQETKLSTGRQLDSVVLKEGVSDNIVEDVRRFLSDREYYERIGVPYRRGYLLHGPPGCGKSCFVEALATHLDLQLYQINLSSTRMTDEALQQSMRDARAGSIILFEDVDALFVERKSSDDNSSRVTFSGLLNALDGVTAQAGRMVFFTTNHPEKLDWALTRRGRIDIKQEIGYCDRDQLRRLFLRFFPSETELARSFAAWLHDSEIPPCDVQHYLLRRREDAEKAAGDVAALAGVSASKCANGTEIPEPIL